MAGVDPGEFGRGAAEREAARADRERAVLGELLTAGWSRSTRDEALGLHHALCAAVRTWFDQGGAGTNVTALELVGQARGHSFADWWAHAHNLDDHTRRLVIECASAVAAMTLLDGFALGRTGASAERRQATDVEPRLPAPTADARTGVERAVAAIA